MMNRRDLFRRWIASAVVVMLAVSAMAGCSSQKPSSDPSGASASVQNGDETTEKVKIAIFTNLTGASASDGEYARRAFEIVEEMMNDKMGGIQSLGGAKIELVYHDMMSDNTMIKTVVEKGLSDPDVAFAVGAMGSGYTMAAVPAISKAGVPMLTTAMADSLDEQNCQYLWLTSPYSSSVAGMTLDYIRYLHDEYDVDTTKIGIVYCDNEYGVNTSSSFQELIESDPSLNYVTIQSYPPTITDMAPVVTQLKASGAELLYVVPDNQDAKLFMQALNSMEDYDPVLIGGGSGMISPPYGDELGDDVCGIMTTAVGSFCQKNVMEDAEWRWAIDTYNERYGGFPGESMTNYMTNLMICKQVMEHTGTTDRETNNAAMGELEFVTPNPTKNNIVKFNETRRNENAVNIMCQWQWVEEYQANIPVCVYPDEFAYSELQFGGGRS